MPDEKLARAIRSRMRRDMLHILNKKGPTTVHDFAERLNTTESSASKHLKLLYDLGFLDFEERSPEKFYFLKFKEIGELFKVYDRIVEKMRKN
jgi:DNA-binding transcriptional ArsR family regulator